jgi:excisionase family DNA binding protein
MLLNPAEAAAILKIHKRTLLEWIADGKVKATKLSRKTIRISLDDLPLSPDEKALVMGAPKAVTASPDLLA